MKYLKYIIALLIILTFTGQAYSAQFIPKYFLQLRDVPSSFSGSGGYCTKVNVGATALEFVSCEIGSHAAFLTAESDPIIKAINGFVQCNGTTCSAATTMNITSIDMSAQTSSIPWIVNTSVPGTFATNGMAWYDSDGYYLAIRDQTNTRNLLFYPKVLTDTYYHPLTSTDNSGDCTTDFLCAGGHGHSQYVLIATPVFTGATDFLQVATPATPDANHTKLYFKSDDKLYKKTSVGVETEIGAGTALAPTIINHTSSATITCQNGNVHTNNGASGTITLKLASMTEAQHCLIKRISAYRINIEPNVETDEIKDVTSGTGKGAYTESDWGQIDLLSYANTKMVPTNAKGTWTEYSPDFTPPTLTSATVPAAGTSISLLFGETVTRASETGWLLNMSGGASAMTYDSGSGSNTLVYTLARSIELGETGTIDWTAQANTIEDTNLNDLASISAAAVTNNSTYSACDSCTGTLMFAWHMENTTVTSGTPCGCSLGDTTATLASGANLYSTTPYDGTNSLNNPTASDNASFDIALEDIFNKEKGTIIFYLRLNAFASNDTILRISMDDNNYLWLRQNGTDAAGEREIRLDFMGNTANVAWITSTADLALATWYKVTVKYTTEDVNPNSSIQIDSVTAETNNTNLTVMNDTSGVLYLGDWEAVSGNNIDLDYIRIYNDWL